MAEFIGAPWSVIGDPSGRTKLRRLARAAWLCLMEARPVVQVVFVLRYVVGVGLAIDQPVNLLHVALGALAWWCAIVFAYLINGVMDVEEDRHNGSRRPIARGDLALPTAGVFTAALALAALGIAWCVPGLVGWVAVFLALGWAYSASPFAAKRHSTSCAIVVFGLGWTSYAAGVTAAGGDMGSAVPVVFASVMAAWMALVGAVVKDLGDAEGDAAAGRRTFAATRGPQAATRLALLGAVLVGGGAPVAAAIWAPEAVPGAAVLTVGAAWVTVECRRLRRSKQGDRGARRSAYRAFMLTQYAANAVMLVVLATH
ncbi:hypothetical protein DN069_06840 [Streptacidiphilus pinicola]|uniref:Homogenitisate phytyltransferase n=1 Tax=Streptacidiphilus pinicola TaxID=2219663 RepID=A0A2X0KGY2_9ACTN|nr:UbiA family prenyltransferase [Streptacidiphilus pinicola]RAG86339.1 hypothetical protein DN069_06840 [Streptacidiphilus pinicola]